MARRAAASRRFQFKRNVVPDKLDLRDRPYMPAVSDPPARRLEPRIPIPVLDQRDTNACTGFALASVINYLLRRAGRGRETPVAPFMLYSMARRYDEFPGPAEEDSGSSLRGAMKGWYKHGVCAERLWKTEKMPEPGRNPQRDWWQDAVRRPLGAYYRVDTRSVTDMHVALNEVGVLYASAYCHRGWDEGFEARGGDGTPWRIPPRKAGPDDGGHAFAIIGYDEHGFLVHNSWGARWGTGGRAILSYEDWIANAMDCWVAQLGVVTRQHEEISRAVSLRGTATSVTLASDVVLRNREISPFIVNMGNNGELSAGGDFRTRREDVEALVTIHAAEARRRWGLRPGDPMDVAIYAHGGLTSEESAATTASRWIPALYENRIFPVFFMWETDLWSTLRNRLADLVSGLPRPAGGLRDQLERWWNERLERLLAPAGSRIWDEMKQNAEAISAGGPPGAARTGARILYECARRSRELGRAKLHLIGHSAGSIVHSYLIDRMARAGWTFETVHFMAPAVRVDAFDRLVVPHVRKRAVRQYHQYHLTDSAEQQDPTCRPILGYGRSLLYLVSQSFERGRRVPILGMERWFGTSAVARLANARVWTAPGAGTSSTTHGGFDDDRATMRTIIALIRESPPAAAATARGPRRGLRAAEREAGLRR